MRDGDRAKGRVNVADSLVLIFLRECKWAQGKFNHLKRKFQIEGLLKNEGGKKCRTRSWSCSSQEMLM